MNKMHAIDVIREKMNPRFTLPVSMIKAAKDWKVGEEYEISLKVKQVRVEQYDEEVDVTFEILKAEAEEMEMEEEESDRNLLEKIERNTRGFATA